MNDRTDRAEQKARASGKQAIGERNSISHPEPNGRISKIESDMAKMSSNMNKQYEELKRLICQKQPKPRTTQETPIDQLPRKNPRSYLRYKQTGKRRSPETNILLQRQNDNQTALLIQTCVKWNHHILRVAGTVESPDISAVIVR